MSTETLPPAVEWSRFRDRLFERIERRRAIASTFTYAVVYFFMARCMKAFNSPGTDKAQEALNAIAEDGSFRLVADTRRDFLAMFPTADQPPDEGDQQDPKDRPGQVRDSATVSPQKPGEGATRPGSGHVPRTEIQREPYRAQASNPSAARRAVQPGDKPERVTPRPVSARPWSGQPFRP